MVILLQITNNRARGAQKGEDMDYQAKIDEILSYVDEVWRANDGGASWAAGEVHRLASHCCDVLNKYVAGDISLAEAYEMTDPFAQTTGAEQDICFAAQDELQRLRKEIEVTSGEGWTLK